MSHASAIVVGTIIGSGIFLVPAEMMQAVGSARLVYLAWIVGGVLSMAGAITYAELGAMKPQAGGEYVYIRDAYGPLPAFLYAWTWFAIAKPASIATMTIGLVRILGTFPVLAFLNDVVVRSPFAITYGQLVAIAAAALITALNYIGVKRAGEFQLLFTILKIAMIVAVSLLASLRRAERGTTLQPNLPGRPAASPALWRRWWPRSGPTTDGTTSTWSAARSSNPGRVIPIALIAGVAVVAGLYMLTNAAVQYVLPASASPPRSGRPRRQLPSPSARGERPSYRPGWRCRCW